ncbi:hypothetical protein [Flavobacterium filum]|jgi:hypothetical protein|uniref:hypothetical protein n=1 Tax=Flavobacterium filum TaxID=370974 RepID=UPI0023F3641E|nr:hypothetical protein [Flavobacterium filum]
MAKFQTKRGVPKSKDFNKKHGYYGRGVGMGIDENGYFVYTHRARSKSYKSELSIPVKVVKWVESTG